MEKPSEPIILAIGGGKGGVGKSMVSANLAVTYARAGMRVILLDLDFGGANLHTLFGIRQPPAGLGDYFTTSRSCLTDYLIPTSVDNLLLGAGSGFIPELANLKHFQKTKLIKQIKGLDADLVLLDLGAGSANNVVDFFSMTKAGIVVTTPEPTAIVNAYEFLKNVVYRILFRMFRKQEEILEILKVSTVPDNALNIATVADLIGVVEKKNRWMADQIRAVCNDLDFYVALNMARKPSQAALGEKLRDICQRHLCLDVNYVGMVYFNEEISTSVFKMRPITTYDDSSVSSKTLQRMAIEIFRQLSSQVLSGHHADAFEAQYARVVQASQGDFEENLLTQRRLERKGRKGPCLH